MIYAHQLYERARRRSNILNIDRNNIRCSSITMPIALSTTSMCISITTIEPIITTIPYSMSQHLRTCESEYMQDQPSYLYDKSKGKKIKVCSKKH